MRRNVDISHPEFHLRLRRLRNSANLTQAELADRAGVAWRSVHDLEEGKRKRAQEKTLRLLARALGTTYEHLVHGIEPPASTAAATEFSEPPERLPRLAFVRRHPGLIALFLAIVAAGVAALFLSRQTTGSPDPSVLPTVAVMRFDNVADPGDPDRLGIITANLLTGALSGSRYLRVIPGYEPASIQSEAASTDTSRAGQAAALRAVVENGAEWAVTGSILRTDPELVVLSRIQDAHDGTVVASQRVTAEAGETIFELAARLAVEIKRDLVLPPGVATEKGLPIERVSTRSVRAYRHYVAGMEYLKRLDRESARRELQTALAHDSTFAVAWAMLAYPELGRTPAEIDSCIEMAERYSKDAGERDKLLIDAIDLGAHNKLDAAIEACERLVEKYPYEPMAYRTLGRYAYFSGDTEKAIWAWERAAEIDPFDAVVFNALAYLHAYRRDFDRALSLVDRYAELAPAEPNPYDTRGDFLAWSGRPDEAIASYRRALQLNSRFDPSIQSLGAMHVLVGRYSEARRYLRMLLGSEDPGFRSRARWLLAATDVYSGRLDDGLIALEQGRAADELEAAIGDAFAVKLYMAASIHAERGDTSRALALTRTAIDALRIAQPAVARDWSSYHLRFLAYVDLPAAVAMGDSLET